MAEGDEDMPEGTSVGDVKQPGIRQGYKDTINSQAGGILQATDWMVVRAAEGGTAVPSDIATWRAAVRTKSNDYVYKIRWCCRRRCFSSFIRYTTMQNHLSDL